VATDTTQALLALTTHSLDLAAYAWPISVGLVIVAVLALTVGSPFRSLTFRNHLSLMLATYLMPLIQPNWVEPPPWRGAALWAVIVIHAVALVAAPALMKGVRLRSLAIVLPSFWLSLSAGFMAGIAIAGVGP